MNRRDEQYQRNVELMKLWVYAILAVGAASLAVWVVQVVSK